MQLAATAEVASGRLEGRVEHAVSGRATQFHTLEELLGFMARVLRQRGGATWHVYPLCDLTWHADGSILYDMTTKTVDLAIWPDSPHGMGAVVASETRAVAMAGTTSALAPQERVNIDTGSAAAFVSQHSLMRHRLKAHVTGKQMVMTQTAAAEFAGLLSVAGPAEAARAQRFMRRVEIIPDHPSVRAMALRETRRVGAADKVIFGTGDQLGIPTMTSDTKFVRGARAQGVDFVVILHDPVPLRGQ